MVGERAGEASPITSVLLCSVICSLVFRLSEFLAEMQHVRVLLDQSFSVTKAEEAYFSSLSW